MSAPPVAATTSASALKPPGPAPVAAASSAPEPPTPSHVLNPVVFERPYKLGMRERLRDDDLARDQDQELARWNEGGRRERWHPQPRVMVDNVRVQGKASASAVLRAARKNGYWPIRRCYDAALVSNQALRGKISLRFTLRSGGKATVATVVGTPTLEDKAVIDCLRKAFRGLDLVRTRKGDAKVTLDIALNPGDAPMKAVEDPPPTAGPGQLDVSVAQALVAAGAGAAVQRCYEAGVERVPGLWGRLALRADIASDGSIVSIVETESTFPDPETASCVADSIRQVRLPAPRGGDLRLMIPVRLGRPQ